MTAKISMGVLVTLMAVIGLGSLSAAQDSGLGGDIYYTKPVKSVLFSHKTHVDDAGLSCSICHDKLFQMSALEAQNSNEFNHKGFKKGKYCGSCHDGSMAFGGDKQCTRCHVGVKGYNRAQKAGKK